MKKFLKFTFPKSMVAIIIGMSKFAVEIFYRRNFFIFDGENFVYTGNILLKFAYFSFEIIFYPFSIIGGLFINLGVKLFGKSIYYGNTPFGMAFNFIGLLILLAYCYFLVCLIFYLANKIKKTTK